MDRQDLYNLLADGVYPVPTLKEATHNTLGVIKQVVRLANGLEERPLEGTRVFIEGVGWFMFFLNLNLNLNLNFLCLFTAAVIIRALFWALFSTRCFVTRLVSLYPCMYSVCMYV